MIVKDGERYIEQCIASVFEVVSEVIIVDTGSTDNTLERVKRFHPQIYHYKWNNNFADARNLSLKHAKSDYILVLDADEVVYPEDLPKLTERINNTDADAISIKFHNITDENSEDTFNTHIGLRIFKNNSFHFEGAIHEQPIFHGADRKAVLENADIKVKHYGYLPSNAGEKKRNRNMPILKELLEKDPNSAFHLFNMGNEYLNIGDYDTALTYYEKSNKYKDNTLAYTPHLMYRMATCLHKMKRNEESLAIIADGLGLYPACTDFEYLRGLILTKMKRFSLALDSFRRCMDMGEAPPSLSFFSETSNFRPLVEMARIYYYMDDYSKALDCYMKAIQINPKKVDIIYHITKMLNKIFADKNTVYQNLCNLFADSSYKPNVMVMTDALLDEKLIEQANTALSKCSDNAAEPDADLYFSRGRLLFYTQKYEAAFEMFSRCVKPGIARGILPDKKQRSYDYMTACSLLCTDLHVEYLEMVNALEDTVDRAVYLAFQQVSDASLDSSAFGRITSVLSKLLSVRAYDVFEHALCILNLVDSNEVLLLLADIYYQNEFHDMAVKTILRSVKELDIINTNAVFILNKEFCIN